MAKIDRVYFDNVIAKDFFRLFVGKKLGGGAARQVFEHAFSGTVVIKIELTARWFQNILEWQTWEAVKDTPQRKWFAPCLSISENGAILLQKRTTPIIGKLPARVPSFFTDLKRDNWGLFEGRPVAHDYGVSHLLSHGLSASLQKADWAE